MAHSRWSVKQVLDLAPDARSVGAARGLTSLRTWSQLGCTDSLVWGRCQGSGREPYQVTVDLHEPAFKCTCPSRKFPCKHGLALLLLWVEHGDAVGEVDQAADFAGDWAAQRENRPSRPKRERAEVADPEAQARRQADREAVMTAGLDELERWLGDLVRQGLAGARRQPYGFWDGAAARLVDAQLPGLAERVRAMGGAVQVRDDWAAHLLSEAGRWYLAIRAWRRRADLGPDVLGDLRAFLGWARRPDEVAAFERVPDRWVVAGVRQGDDGTIVSQRTWLRGEASGRWVVILDFAAAGAALRVAHVVGTVVEDALVLYPGSEPPRAAFGGGQRVVGSGRAVPGTGVGDAVDRLSAWLASDPWRDRLPVALAGVVAVEDGGRWWLHDGAGDRLPLARSVEPWALVALTGGAPAAVFAEWDSGAVHPLAVLAPEPVPL